MTPKLLSLSEKWACGLGWSEHYEEIQNENEATPVVPDHTQMVIPTMKRNILQIRMKWNLSPVNGNKLDTDEIMNVVKDRLSRHCSAPNLKEANIVAHRRLMGSVSGYIWSIEMFDPSESLFDPNAKHWIWTTESAEEYKEVNNAVYEHSQAEGKGLQSEAEAWDKQLPEALQAHQSK